MKRILFIIHDPSRTGAPLVALSTIKEILKNHSEDFAIDILLLSERKGGLQEEFETIAQTYYYWNVYSKWEKRLHRYFRVKLDKFKYKKFLYKNHYDLIYANTIISLPAAIEIKKEFGTPILLHVHESECDSRCSQLSSEQLSNCTKFIAVSDQVKNLLIIRGVDVTNIKLIFPVSNSISKIMNGFEMPSQNTKKGKFTVVFSSRFGWSKGGDLIASLISRMETKYNKDRIKYLHVGAVNPFSQIEFEHDCTLLNITSEIEFTGKVADPLIEFSKGDAFVLLSRDESFCMTFVENCGIGKPSIMFHNATGCEQLFTNEKDCLIVPYLDIDRICDAIHSLYIDESMRTKIGQAARETVFNIFKEYNPITETIDLINEVLSRPLKSI